MRLGSGLHRDERVRGLVVVCHKSTKTYAVQGDVRCNGRHVRTVRVKIDRVDRIGLKGDLGGEFGLESLVDKRLAVVPDAHDAPARNRGAALERIKSMTGGDAVSVNRKDKPIIQAKLRTKLLVNCNRLPKSSTSLAPSASGC